MFLLVSRLLFASSPSLSFPPFLPVIFFATSFGAVAACPQIRRVPKGFCSAAQLEPSINSWQQRGREVGGTGGVAGKLQGVCKQHATKGRNNSSSSNFKLHLAQKFIKFSPIWRKCIWHSLDSGMENGKCERNMYVCENRAAVHWIVQWVAQWVNTAGCKP